MDYETVIGLEIHVELLTESKMFCGCAVEFGGAPNTRTCPVCLGLPGSLPVINKKAIEYTVKIGLALNCEIASFTQFHRKNYFYPDMPKDYQISQYDLPLCGKGYVDVARDGKTNRVGITRVHIEEDTGKLVHVGETGRISEAAYSLVDFNRAGTPLAEIVTEPDIRSPDEAKIFLQKLKNTIQHLGVSDCNMEEGSLRCDANISVRPKGGKKKGVKTEVKNMNSFRALEKALTYEVKRQEKILSEDGEVEQETRHWDSDQNITTSLRTKEYAHDYRYFPEPDLVPMELDKVWVDDLKGSLPELPEARKKRFQESYGLSAYDAEILTSSKAMGDFFEECMENYRASHPPARQDEAGQAGRDAKKVSNWMLGELSMHLNAANLEVDEAAVTPKHLVQLLKLIDDKTISGKMAKSVFEEMFKMGKLPKVIVEEKGLVQITDAQELEKIVDMAVEQNPKAVGEYKQGKTQVLGFLVGQVMKLTKGQANPALVNQLLKKKLG